MIDSHVLLLFAFCGNLLPLIVESENYGNNRKKKNKGRSRGLSS